MAVGSKDMTVTLKRKELRQQLSDQLITKAEFDKKWKSFLNQKEEFESGAEIAAADYNRRKATEKAGTTWATPPAEVKHPATKPIPKKQSTRTKRPNLSEQIKERKRLEKAL